MKKVVLVLGLMAIGAYSLFSLKASGEPEKPVLSIEEYTGGAEQAAEEGGKEAVEEYREERLGEIGKFANDNFEWEHSKMLNAIANRDYSACVSAYKGSHSMPGSGWGDIPYAFCQEAITQPYHADPVVTDIIEQGGTRVVRPGGTPDAPRVVIPGEVIVEPGARIGGVLVRDIVREQGGTIISRPESARTREDTLIHPLQYKWIVEHTECDSIHCEHYRDYEIGWQDARINGYAESHPLFYDKVMEFAGMKKSWFGGGWKW